VETCKEEINGRDGDSCIKPQFHNPLTSVTPSSTAAVITLASIHMKGLHYDLLACVRICRLSLDLV
jgi:hypothetical protein